MIHHQPSLHVYIILRCVCCIVIYACEWIASTSKALNTEELKDDFFVDCLCTYVHVRSIYTRVIRSTVNATHWSGRHMHSIRCDVSRCAFNI